MMPKRKTVEAVRPPLRVERSVATRRSLLYTVFWNEKTRLSITPKNYLRGNKGILAFQTVSFSLDWNDRDFLFLCQYEASYAEK